MTNSDYISIIALLISCIALGFAFFQHLSNRKNTFRLLTLECMEKLRELEVRLYKTKDDLNYILEDIREYDLAMDQKSILDVLAILNEFSEKVETRFDFLQQSPPIDIPGAQKAKSAIIQETTLYSELIRSVDQLKHSHKELMTLREESE